MKMNIYAIYDSCSQAIIRFEFANTDASLVRDNLNKDLYDERTKTGTPLKDLEYIRLGQVDIDNIKLIPEEPTKLDKLKLYDFKINEVGQDKEKHEEKKE